MRRPHYRQILPVILLLGALIGALFASQALAVDEGQIKGVVRDAGTRARLANVTVRVLFGPAAALTQTDARGRYTLENLPPGRYDLIFQRVDYADRVVNGVRVVPSQFTRTNALLTRLDPTTGTILVEVTQSKKQPVPGATVDLFSSLGFQARGTTDAAGVARFPARQPDVYSVEVSRDGFRDKRKSGVTLRAGQEVRVALKLKTDPNELGAIAGTVRSEAGGVIRDVVVELVTGFSSPAVTMTNNLGRYRLRRLAPDRAYTVLVQAAGFQPEAIPNVQVRSQATTTINVTLRPIDNSRGAIFGVITDPSGRPIVGARVLIITGPSLGGETVSGVEGQYALTNLLPGSNYSLSATATGFISGSRAAIVVVGGQATRINLTLSRVNGPVGALSGVVQNLETGQPLQRALVQIIIGVTGGQALTDSTGFFLLPNLQPADGYGLRVEFPGFAPEEVLGVQVRPGQTTGVDVQLMPVLVGDGAIVGTARRRNGRVLPNVRVEVIEGPSAPLEDFTDARGEYGFTNVAAGEGYTLAASLPGFETVTVRDVTVRNGETVGVDFVMRRLRAAGTIAGRVTDLGLVPVVGARVRVIAGPSFPPDAITGLGGTFRMENLPEGRYDLLITSDAFQPARFGNVVVTRKQTVNVNIVLLR